MTYRPRSVTTALFLILLNALIWLVFGVIIAANAHPALPVLPVVKGVMAFLAFAITAVLLVLFFFLRKQDRVAWYLIIALFVAISILTIFDDFGWIDLVVFIINIAPVILLFMGKAWFLSVKSGKVASQ
jgi:hypothetical protein